MRVRDLPGWLDKQAVVAVRCDETAAAGAERMHANQVGSVVVLDREGRLAGILTERDLLISVLAANRDPARTPIVEVMTRPVICCGLDWSLVDVQRVMAGQSFRHVPVVDGGKVVGMVSVREVAATVADSERSSRDLTIFALARLAESRDPETGLHLERVREYAGVLSQALATCERFRDEIDEEFLALIRVTSALHDIGKVSIPDYILLKPDRLTSEEFEIMKTHSTRGAETLETALRRFPDARYLQMARDVAAYHHERHDGTGYPDGLAGDAIPLCARIFALADVYDALASKRVYKEAFSHEVARNIILENNATQFDPDVVAAFSRCDGQFRAIQGEFRRRKDDGQPVAGDRPSLPCPAS
jgi:HD-GYP domain-containing protein (c-di-GMP phosphodiesterase class II)